MGINNKWKKETKELCDFWFSLLYEYKKSPEFKALTPNSKKAYKQVFDRLEDLMLGDEAKLKEYGVTYTYKPDEKEEDQKPIVVYSQLNPLQKKVGAMITGYGTFSKRAMRKRVAYAKSRRPNPKRSLHRIAKVNAFFWDLITQTNLSAYNKNFTLRLVRMMYMWGERNGFVTADMVPRFRRLRHERREEIPFTIEEMDQLRLAVENGTISARQSLTAVAMYFSFHMGGLRTSEVLSLVWGDIVDGKLSVRGGKGRVKDKVSRKLNVTEGAKWSLSRMAIYGIAKGDRVFRDNWGPLNESRISLHLKAIKKAMGWQKERRFYNVRHGAATEMLNKGLTEYQIGGILGHREIKITREHYLRPSLDAVANNFGGFQ